MVKAAAAASFKGCSLNLQFLRGELCWGLQNIGGKRRVEREGAGQRKGQRRFPTTPAQRYSGFPRASTGVVKLSLQNKSSVGP